MIKKWISLISATAILLTVFLLTPLSAAADSVDGGALINPTATAEYAAPTDESSEDSTLNVSENIDEPPTETEAQETAAPEETQVHVTEAVTEAPTEVAQTVHVDGFFEEDGVNYFYRGGKRVEQNWYQKERNSKIYNRSEWLYTLLSCAGIKINCGVDNDREIFETAKANGVISSYTEEDYSASVSRRYAAQTIVNALKYPARRVSSVSDTTDSSMLTAAYYSYFIPDKDDKLHPYDAVTAEEFDCLISELKLYQALKGKKLTVFGDSIMFGAGNPVGSAWEGPGELIGRKYGMDYKDYSKPGAVMGKSDGKSHIADQVRSAIKDGRKSDLIIFNGGSNDVWHSEIALGSISAGYNMTNIGESSFSNGFEKTMWLISEQWKDAPVIYIRTHRNNLGSQTRQREIGERALVLCEKWRAAGIDLYNRSALDGTKYDHVRRYTEDVSIDARGIHPNALGYAEFYLPPIGETVSHIFSLFYMGDCCADEEINAIDVIYIQQYSAGIPIDADDNAVMSGDIDGSGVTDILDASYIQKSLAGMDIPYTVGEVIR
ncbi:MAG: hypothetical protein IJH07_00075 [Ruminococcus sp.]|nr:hypothetical protein [Ruminococcus sp.]